MKMIYLTDDNYRALKCLAKRGVEAFREYLSDTKEPRIDGYSDEEAADVRILSWVDVDTLMDASATPGVVTLDAREAANVLTALRVMQFDVEQGADFSGHMSLDGHDIMSGEEIDALCEHINVPARNDGLAVPTVGTGSIPEERMAVLSTGHVPFEESIHIGVLIDDGDIIGMCRDEGWLVHTTPLRESCRGLVPQLNYVLGYLRDMGYRIFAFVVNYH